MRPKRLLWRLLLWPLLSAIAALVACTYLPLTYTAVATIEVRASARPWAERPGLGPVMRQPALYVALLESERVANRVIREFELQAVYGEETLSGTRQRLSRAVQFGVTRGGLLVIQASDRYAWRAADLANQYAAELQTVLDELRVEAAHASADMLNAEVELMRQQLAQAHRRLRTSQVDAGQLKLQPRLTQGWYAGLAQSLRSAQQQLAVQRATLQDGSAEVLDAQARVEALRGQVLQAEAPDNSAASVAYADAERDVKRLESGLQQLRVHAMQAELDAGNRAEALLSVDRAQVPLRPSGPRALRYMAAAWALTLAGLLARAWLRRGGYRRSGGRPPSAAASLA